MYMTDWTLLTSTRSPFVRKVVMAAYELDLLGRIAFVGVATTPMEPSAVVLEHSPLGMIPTLLIADGEMLTGSDVILDFLNETAPEAGLIPANGSARRDVLRRQAVADGAMDKAVKWLDERFREQNEDTRVHIDGYARSLLAVAAWFDGRVFGRERPDAGDLSLYCLLGYLNFRFPECEWRTGNARLADWYDGMNRRPAAEFSRPEEANY
jgi:glutathione S-transferase